VLAAATKSQETSLLLKEANNFERQLKEPEALNKYKDVLITEPNNIIALLKAAELSCATGERLQSKNDKRLTFESALAFARRAVMADSLNASSWSVLALANSKLAEIENDNKKLGAWLNEAKLNADKALQLNPALGFANFLEGKWMLDMLAVNWPKRMAIKASFGKLPETDIDVAIDYLEKCKKTDPYFMLNYWILAKAYKEKNRPAQQMEVLNKLVKLPIRTFDDAAIKAEAQKMLNDLN
jgi:hypothetical protein